MLLKHLCRMHIEWRIIALFLCGIVSVLVSLRPDADAVNVNKFAQTSWPLAFIQGGSSTLHRASGTKAAVPEAKVLKNVNASEAGGPIRSDGRNNGRRTRNVCCPLPDDISIAATIALVLGLHARLLTLALADSACGFSQLVLPCHSGCMCIKK